MGEELDDDEDIEEEFDGEDEAAEEDEEDGAKQKGNRKRLIIPAILLLLIGGGIAAYFMGFLDPILEIFQSEPTVEQVEQVDSDAVEPELPSLDPLNVVFVETPEILADLKHDGPRRNYLKIKLNFELERPEDTVNMQIAMPRVVDAITVYLREMSMEDFKGSEGIHRLQQELLLRVNAVASPVRITDVLIADFLLQG